MKTGLSCVVLFFHLIVSNVRAADAVHTANQPINIGSRSSFSWMTI